MSVKSYLKAAKNALVSNDPDSCIEYAEKALNLEQHNYFANIFLGKAYHLQSDPLNATKYYKTCCEIDTMNELGWKGLLLLTRDSEDYESFLSVLKGYAEMKTKKNEPLGEIVKEIDIYLKKFEKNENLCIAILNSTTSFGFLGKMNGSLVIPEERSLILLIDTLKRKEERIIASNIKRTRMNIGNNISLEVKNQVNSIKWAVYSKSMLPDYISRLLEICEDNDLQKKYDNLSLSYQLDVLSCAPDGDTKTNLQKKIFVACEGIVAVRREVKLAWDIYLNWLDPQNVDDLPLWLLCDYIRLFGMEGLGSILYGFVYSDYSIYAEDKVRKYLKAEETYSKKNREDKRAAHFVNVENYEVLLSQFKSDFIESTALNDADLMSLYVKSIEKASNSLLACRIVSEFYISLKEYKLGLMYCRKGVNLLTKVLRDYGLNLPNTKESLLLDLASIYTYYDAPKDHPRAFKLYESILQRNPSNPKAKIGKSLIFLQLGEFSKAKELLQPIFNTNIEAKAYLGWCDINLKNFEYGRCLLTSCLKETSLQDEKMKVEIQWRLAHSYLQEIRNLNDRYLVEENIREAYANLVVCLKQDATYAPAYTSLGIVYEDYLGDSKRANKCYYKAFELDVRQLESARRLVVNFALEPDWESVRVLAQRVVDSEISRRSLADTVDPAWPYRSLGCALLEVQEDVKAITCFQSALRIDSKDTESWVGLGQAYLSGGRLEASIKVFNHILNNLDSNWFTSYMLALSLYYEGQFAESISILQKLLSTRPSEKCILTALIEAFLTKSQDDLSKGFVGRCIEASIMSLDFIFQLSEIDIHCHTFWRYLSETILLFTKVKNSLPSLYLGKISAVSQRIAIERSDLCETGDGMEYREGFLVEAAGGTNCDQAISYMIQSAKTAIQVLPQKSSNKLRASLFYNLGLIYYHAFTLTNKPLYLNCSIKPLQRAILIEPVVADYWIALGNSTIFKNPRVAQHCYIKASSISSIDHSVFVNLGSLYLIEGDTALAGISFDRALSMQPNDCLAWLGLALSRTELSPDATSTFGLFAHAMVLSNGESPLAQLLYAFQVLKKVAMQNKFHGYTITERQEISLACGHMLRYLKFDPEHVFALFVTLSLTELTQKFEIGVEIANTLFSSLERTYRERESVGLLYQLTAVKSQQARLYLGFGQYGNAIIAAKMAMDMLEDDVLPRDSRVLKCVLSSRSVIGLSYFFNGQLSKALSHLKVCLENSDSYRLVILLAQILHTFGNQDTKIVAMEELFNHIEERNPSLPITLTMGAIAIIDDLKDILPVINEDLKSLSLEQLGADSSRNVPQMVHLINQRLGIKENIWQKVAFLFPNDGRTWSKLDNGVALEVFYNSKSSGSCLSTSSVKTGRLLNIQRGIFLDPSQEISYKALLECIPT
ncbi:BA75_02330T0 [Komagataella pastoris]|uniref:BA75_02330T0 n=1 Tax=Komagataella pastoris TaxID=4922 RepID=A0A1B2JDG9_PICPA|nr:BA75_02330T0 [Komagataella pastoris]